jgi:hypothetical protein
LDDCLMPMHTNRCHMTALQDANKTAADSHDNGQPNQTHRTVNARLLTYCETEASGSEDHAFAVTDVANRKQCSVPGNELRAQTAAVSTYEQKVHTLSNVQSRSITCPVVFMQRS